MNCTNTLCLPPSPQPAPHRRLPPPGQRSMRGRSLEGSAGSDAPAPAPAASVTQNMAGSESCAAPPQEAYSAAECLRTCGVASASAGPRRVSATRGGHAFWRSRVACACQQPRCCGRCWRGWVVAAMMFAPWICCYPLTLACACLGHFLRPLRLSPWWTLACACHRRR